MSHVIQPGASMHGIALNHDFQQNPVGSLGGRNVQQGQAQAPRSLGSVLSGVGRNIQNLGARLLNAVTPHGVRADSKFRTGMQDTGAKLGQLLGALSQDDHQAADPATAHKLLQGLRATAEPVTGRGVAYDQLIAQRTAVHLANMTPAQRESLHTGLAQAQQNAQLHADPTLAILRSTMENSALKEGVQALQGDLDLAIGIVAKETQDKGITGRAFEELYIIARKVLESQGFERLPRNELKQMSRALVLQVLEQRVNAAKSPADLAPLEAMFNQLPSKQLCALVREEKEIASQPADNVRTVLISAISLRTAQLDQTLTAGFADLLSRTLPAVDDPNGILHNPQGFARQVAETGQALADFRDHLDLHGMHFPERLDAAYARTLDHLERYLSADNLIQLPELNSSQLHAMEKGLGHMGVENGQAEITADATRRRTESLDAYAQVLLPSLQTLVQSDTGEAFRLMASAKLRGDSALKVHMNLGLKVDGADDLMAFHEKLVLHTIQSLDTPTLQALSQRLNSPAANDLIDALASTSMRLLSGGERMAGYDDGVARTIFDRSTDISMLRSVADTLLRQRGADIPAPAWANAPVPADFIRTEYGFTMTTDDSVAVHAGKVGPAVLKSVQANIDGILKTLERAPVDERHPLVSSAFVCDFPRSQYSIVDNNGVKNELDKPNGRTPEAMIENAVEQLRQLAGGNDHLLMLATQLANQNIHAGLQDVLMTQKSPLRLNDGTAGRLNGSEESIYTFSSDGEGGLNLRLDYTVSNATGFIAAPLHASGAVEAPVPLNPDQSNARFGFALHIGADLSVRVSEPMQYAYEAVRAVLSETD